MSRSRHSQQQQRELETLRQQVQALQEQVDAQTELIGGNLIRSLHFAVAPFTIVNPETGLAVARFSVKDGEPRLTLYDGVECPCVQIDPAGVQLLLPDPSGGDEVIHLPAPVIPQRIPYPPTCGPHGLN